MTILVGEYAMQEVPTLTQAEVAVLKEKFETAGISANVDGLE